MIIYNEELSVCPLTTHIPIKLVANNISKNFKFCNIQVCTKQKISKFISFKNALDNSSNHVEIKVGFKDKSGKELDHEDLYEGYSDIPTEVTIL